MGLETVGTRNTAEHQDIAESKDKGTGTVGTRGSTGHQNSGVTSQGTRGQLEVHTRPQGEVWTGGGRGLAQPLEVAQVLEDEDEGGPAEDDAAEGAALQQPRQERPQALGQPRAPRHGPRPGWHQPGVSSPSLWVTKARHHTTLAPTGGTGTPGVHRGIWQHVATWAKAPALPLVPGTAAGTSVLPCARVQGRALQKPGLTHLGTAVDILQTHTDLQVHTCVYRCTHRFMGAPL